MAFMPVLSMTRILSGVLAAWAANAEVSCNGVTDTLEFAVQPGLAVRGATFSAKRTKRWVISVSSAVPTDALDLVLQSRSGKRLAAKHVVGPLGSLVVPKSAWADAAHSANPTHPGGDRAPPSAHR